MVSKKGPALGLRALLSFRGVTGHMKDDLLLSMLGRRKGNRER